MAVSLRETIESRIRPGEQLIWQGKPEYEADTQTMKRSPALKALLYIVASMAALWILKDQLPGGSIDKLSGGLGAGPIIGIIGAILIIFVLPGVLRHFKFDNQSRLDRYFLSQEYAITNQRLIINDDGNMSSYGPEDLTELKIRDRGNGLGDVQFFRRASDAHSNLRDPVTREGLRIGFKMLRNPESIKQRIDQWAKERLNEAQATTAAFTAGDADAGNRFQNAHLALSFVAPDGWDVKVRKKKQPYGAKFLDKEYWQPIGAADDWNTVRLEGPLNCEVEFELFETEPMVTFKGMSKSRLIRMLAGKPVESDPDFELCGMPGFQLTYRKKLAQDKVGVPAMLQMSRIHVLHDGHRQLYIISRWPEGSDELAEAVDTIVQSISVS